MAYGYSFVKYDVRDPLMIWVRDHWGSNVMSQSTEAFNHILAIFVLSFALYPYVYIISRAAFSEISYSYSEIGKTLGLKQSSIFFKIMGAKNISIAAGMFNRPIKLKTTMNIFVKGKLDYYKLDHHIPKFKRYP